MEPKRTKDWVQRRDIDLLSKYRPCIYKVKNNSDSRKGGLFHSVQQLGPKPQIEPMVAGCEGCSVMKDFIMIMFQETLFIQIRPAYILYPKNDEMNSVVVRPSPERSYGTLCKRFIDNHN